MQRQHAVGAPTELFDERRVQSFNLVFALQHAHDRGVVPSSAPLGDRCVQEFLAGGSCGESDLERLGALKRQVQILLVEFDAKARVEVALNHPRSVHFENTGVCKSTH